MNRVAITLLTLLSAGALNAQDGGGKTLLSFDEALYRVNTRNDQITALNYEEEVAEKEKKAAYGLRLPNVGISGTYAYMSDDMAIDLNEAKGPVGNLVGGIGGLLPPATAGQINQMLAPLMQKDWTMVLQDRSVGMVGASVTMPVYMGGKINAANNAAKIKVEEAREKGNQTKNALVSELAERYFGLSLANQVVDVRRQVLEGMEKHLRDAKELEANGMIARAERLYAEMHVAEAHKELQKALRDVQTIHTALCNTMNEEGAYAPVTTMFVVNDIENLDYFKQLAADRNPLLKQVGLKEQLAKEGVRAQRADFMPQVALMGGYDLYNYQLTKLAPTWVVGAGIRIKLFDGLNREYKYSAAKSQVKQVQALNSKAGSDVNALVEKVYNEMVNNGEQIVSDDVALEFAKEYLRIKEQAFREGSAPSSDVVDARLNLAKIKTERLQAAYTYDVLLARLLEICGDSQTYTAYITARPITPIHFE